MTGGSKSESKSTSTQQSQSGSGQQWANPYAVSGVNEIMSVYQANKPNLEAQSAQANQLSADLAGNYGAQSKVGGQGRDYQGQVISGKFVSGNPYLDAMIKQMSGGVTDRVNSQFTSAGRYGSGAHTGVLTEELGNLENQLRYGNYTTEMARRDQAAQAAQQQQNAAAALAMQQQQQAAQLPYTGSAELAQALSALFGGGTSTGTSTSTSKSEQSQGLLGPIMQGLGAAGGAYAASDPRLKHSVVPLVEEPDGLGWYEFSYHGSDDRFVGVMADEVAEYRPWALGPLVAGFMTVNYEAL